MKDFECIYSHANGYSRRKTSLDLMLKENEVLVRPKYVGLCGSDLLQFEQCEDTEIKLGHEWVGTVESIGEKVESLIKGDIVTSASYIACGACDKCADGDSHRCEKGTALGKDILGAARSQIILPEHSLIQLSGDISPSQTVYEILSIAEEAVIQMIDTCNGTLSSEVLILGSGPIGVAVAKCLERQGVNTLLTDRRPKRAEWAKSMALNAISLPFLMLDEGKRSNYKYIIDCTSVTGGDPGGLEHLTFFAAESARILIVAKYRKEDKLPFYVLSNRRCRISFLSSASTNRLMETIRDCAGLLKSIEDKYISHIFQLEHFDNAIEVAFEKNQCGKVIVQIQ
ncbi:MAG: alcohol dehydrogenase catalytic domain-containing protein [Bacteriovoracaceae bacterium]|nr:alcohol dehydrogenase catalytic domain-containing protein [Bacteriovoracaceae bacterium]